MSPRPPRGARRTVRIVVVVALAVFAAVVAFAAIRIQTHPVAALERTAPKRTALMKQREHEARAAGRALRIDQRWVGYGNVSPTLRRAILIAEDDKFFSHDGLDWVEIQASARKNLEQRKVVRGGSTVTQQLAKNLYLGDARTLTRKFEEAFLAMRIERSLPKRRIFELYLNLIEWGDGIFGAEAAARRYFGVPASRLTERQAVLLAAVIINPRRFSVLHPNRRIERRVRLIASRMRRRGYFTQEQYAAAIGAPVAPPTRSLTDWFFGGDSTAAKAPAAAPESIAADPPPPGEPVPAPGSAVPETTTTGRHDGASDAWGTRYTPLARLPHELRAGEIVEIRWEKPPRDIEEMELLLSIDDGRHFTLRISPEIDPGSRRFRWRVPNLATETARIAMRVGREVRHDRGTPPDRKGVIAGVPGSHHATASRHDETLLAPSEPFRLIADPEAPPARFALREGWTWVGDTSEPALPAATALRQPDASLVATHDTASAEAPPRAPLVALPATVPALLRAACSRMVRARGERFSIPMRFVPLRN